MRYFPSSASAFIIALFVNTSPAFAAIDDFDAAILIKKSFWANISNVISMASIDLPSGKIYIIDATLCEAGIGEATFLISFKQTDPQPMIVTQEGDCTTPVANLVSANANPGYDGLAFVAVRQQSTGLKIATTEASIKPATSISSSLLQEIRSFEKVATLQNVDVGDGSFTELWTSQSIFWTVA